MLRRFTLAACTLFVFAALAPAQPDAMAVIDKAIEAQGGTAALTNWMAGSNVSRRQTIFIVGSSGVRAVASKLLSCVPR